MTDSSTIWRLNVHGLPMPKGSMSCVGSRGGRGAHTLIESDPSGAKKKWRQHLTEACRDLARKIPGVPLDEPVAVGCLFRLPRPRTSRLAWPTSHQSGDLDKLKRAVLDCLTDGGVLRDDSRVVSMVDAKVYSPEPGVTVYVAAASSLEPLSRMLKAIEEACR